MSATRVYVKVKNIRDPKDELGFALLKFKRKMKETRTLVDYLEHQSFKRPAEKRREKSLKAARYRRKKQVEEV